MLTLPHSHAQSDSDQQTQTSFGRG